MKRILILIVRAMVIVILLFVVSFIVVFSTDDSIDLQAIQRENSTALRANLDSTLGRLTNVTQQKHNDQSGFMLLERGIDAYQQRISLAKMAEKSIDAQYYIWNGDQSGKLLAWHMLQAADRGVRVRILLDDFNVGARDLDIAALNAYQNIQVRIYNPTKAGFRAGIKKIFGFLNEFKRLNRRMHNKSYVVDGSVGIVGGRNIGDEYFDQDEELNFRDRDVLAVGPIVSHISNNFDSFWNSDFAVPIEALVEKVPTIKDTERLTAALQKLAMDSNNPARDSKAQHSVNSYVSDTISKLVWAPAELIYDKPPSSMDDTAEERPQYVAKRLGEMLRDTQHSVLMESAYLVAGAPEKQMLSNMIKNGVQVKALTNSMASNDVLTNHAAYARNRKDLLKVGVDLYELRPDATSCIKLVARDEQCGENYRFALHSKSMVVDTEVLYVGSFNLNLRSIYFNTETALIIHSKALAKQLSLSVEENMKAGNAWHVTEVDGNVQWRTIKNNKEVVESREPETDRWERLQSWFITLLPLEKYF